MSTERTATEEAPVLRAIDVTKHFEMPGGARVHAVEHVDVTLRPGRIVALVGESGSGKTTVARLLARMYATTSGTIELNGEPVATRRAPGRDYHRQVQLIFQDPFGSLHPGHTIGYTLQRPLLIHRHARTKAQARSLAAELLEQVGLTASPGLPVQAPALPVGRSAPARGHRPRARGAALGAAGRRADLHARRIDPPGHAQPPRQAP